MSDAGIMRPGGLKLTLNESGPASVGTADRALTENLVVEGSRLMPHYTHSPLSPLTNVKSSQVRFHRDFLNDPGIQLLPPDEFKARFFAALNGEVNEFSKMVRVVSLRPVGPEWRKVREDVFARDGYACVYCGDDQSPLECDHVIPLSRGGSSDPENLATACYSCNRAKRNRTPDEWRSQWAG